MNKMKIHQHLKNKTLIIICWTTILKVILVGLDSFSQTGRLTGVHSIQRLWLIYLAK